MTSSDPTTIILVTKDTLPLILTESSFRNRIKAILLKMWWPSFLFFPPFFFFFPFIGIWPTMKAWLQCELWKASNIILLPFFSKFQLYQSLRTVHRILALRGNIKASPTSLVRSQGVERRSVSNTRASFRWLQLGQKQNSYICFPHLHDLWFIYKMKIITLAFYGSRLLRLKFTDYSLKSLWDPWHERQFAFI